MSEERRQGAITGAAGLTGMFGAGAMGHAGLNRAYGGKGTKRPRIGQQIRYITHKPGRKLWAGSLALGAASLPVAAWGVNRATAPPRKVVAAKRDTIYQSGKKGVKEALHERVVAVGHDSAPASLKAGNYAGSTAIGSGIGALTGLAIRRKTHLPGSIASGLAVASGTAAGSASLPLQARVMRRASHGQYESTPTGVRRVKTAPVRPSRRATVVDSRPGRSNMHPAALREQMGPVGKAAKVPPHLNFRRDTLSHTAHSDSWANDLNVDQLHNEKARGHHIIDSDKPAFYKELSRRNPGSGWDRLSGAYKNTKASSAVSGQAHDRKIHSMTATSHYVPTVKRPRVRAGLAGAGVLAVTGGGTAYAMNRKKPVKKADKVHGDYPGQLLSTRKKRTIVMTASQMPFVGDLAGASAAGRMAPPHLRKKTAAYQLGGTEAGNLVGGAAGAYGAMKLGRNPHMARAGRYAEARVHHGVNLVRSKVGMKPMKPKPDKNVLERSLGHKWVPKKISRALGPIARTPKSVAAGFVGGAAVGSQVGAYLGYGHALKLEKEHNRSMSAIKAAKVRHSNMNTRHGGISKRMNAATKEAQAQSRRKRWHANMSQTSGLMGMSALASGAVSRVPKFKAAAKVTTPLLAGAAGVGGAGSVSFARLERKDAKRDLIPMMTVPVVKAYSLPHIRVSSMRRRATGGSVRYSRVAGGLVR